jgi:glutamate-ammonia-ligase adenylyltransferase
MALTRARCVAGAQAVCAEAEAVRAAILGAAREARQVWEDLARMRARIAEAKPPQGALDVKPGPGGMQDIELLAQASALVARCAARTVAGQFAAAVEAGLIAPATAEALMDAHRLARAVTSAGRLLVDGPLTAEALGQGARAMLCRETGRPDLARLEADLARLREATSDAIDAVLAARPEPRSGGRG